MRTKVNLQMNKKQEPFDRLPGYAYMLAAKIKIYGRPGSGAFFVCFSKAEI